MGWEPTVPGTRPLHLDLVEQIRSAIRRGELRPGDRLPTHRRLAAAAGVTVSTATGAYREAARLHLVAGQVGRGTFVLADSGDADLFAATAGRSGPGPSPPEVVDLSANTPAPVSGPGGGGGALAAAAARVAGSLADGYPSTSALLRGRLSMERWLASTGLHHRADQIHLTAGAQQALLVALVTVAGPGATVLAERLTFPGLLAVARVLRLRLVPVALDERGLLPDDLDRQAARSGAAVLVTVPVLQNPTGAVMDDGRRRAVAVVARARRLTVIEDDVYRPLTDEAPLASVLPERTVVVTGLSKTVEPGLRLGSISGPAELLGSLDRETHLHQWLVSPLALEIFDRWVGDGTTDERARRQRAETVERWRLAAAVLGPHPGTPSPHRFLELTRSPDVVAADLARAGVIVSPSSNHGVGARPPKGIRVSLTAAPGRAALHDALVRLDEVVGARRVR